MRHTVTTKDGNTKYSVRCPFCKERWIESADHYTNLAQQHHCHHSDTFRTRERWFDYLSVWLKFDAISWNPRADGSTSKCDGRCTSAKGQNCDCQCGGQNHGINA